MSNGPKFLPYGRQTVDDEDVAAVGAALKSDFLTTGPLVDQFEAAFASATGAQHAIACNSGTAALHLAAMAAGLGEGDLAVVPTLTFLATANAVRMTGAEVVFADVDPDSGLMTAETLNAAIKSAKGNIRAAFPVHLGGRVCDMAALAKVSSDLMLIEDACHALGVPDAGATKYSFAACFSTHPVKAIATGEGGIVTTRDDKTAARMRELRSHGMKRGVSSEPWHYEMQEIGWNYRMPDILCALGISQLKKLEQFWNRRNVIAAKYDRLLAPLAPVVRPVPRGNSPHGLHLYSLLIDFTALKTTRAKFMNELKQRGIGSQVHYIPVHTQPYYRARYGEKKLPGAEAYYSRCLSIPLYPSLNDEDVKRVAREISALAGARP